MKETESIDKFEKSAKIGEEENRKVYTITIIFYVGLGKIKIFLEKKISRHFAIKEKLLRTQPTKINKDKETDLLLH